MIEPVQSEKITFDSAVTSYATPETKDSITQQNLPVISKDKVSVTEGKINLPPRSGVTLKLPVNAKKETVKVEFTVSENDLTDITEELNSKALIPKYFHSRKSGSPPFVPEEFYLHRWQVFLNVHQ